MSRTILLLSALLLSACSLSKISPFSLDCEPGVFDTLTGLSNSYLQGLVMGREDEVKRLRLTSKTLLVGEELLPASEIDSRVENFSALMKNKLDSIPPLELENCKQDGDSATVNFRANNEHWPFKNLEINFLWTGTGWLVVRDSIVNGS